MCQCTPNKRTPVCENCPHDLQVKWGITKERGTPLNDALEEKLDAVIARIQNELDLRDLRAKYHKVIAYIHKLDEVSDCEYPFGLTERDDIQRPDEILKELGE